MTVGSTVVGFKQAVRDALEARLEPLGVQVTYEFPAGHPTNEDVWLGDAEGTSKIPTMRAGTKKVDETYELLVFLQVLKTRGEGQESADVRAAELLGEVQQLFAENPQVVSTIHSAQITKWTHSTGSYDGGDSAHGSRFEITVTVTARLFP